MHPSVSEVTLGAAVFLGSSQNHPLASLSGSGKIGEVPHIC